MGGNYIWLFIVKELFVTASLFYSASWVISKWVSKGRLYPLFIFIIGAYIWWTSCTYIVCYFARFYIPESDLRFDRYLAFVLSDGFLDLFSFQKFSVLVLDFIFLVSVPLAPKLVKSLMEDSFKILKLERDNLAMELDFLKSQISPHFLFNTLNNIYWMSEKGDPRTSTAILGLSNLVRYSLYQSKDDKILLSKEVQFIKDYIDLAGLRCNVPIRIEIVDIDEPYKIVPLVLMPFVENAFKHGPFRSKANSWVEIHLKIENDNLIFIVKNSVNNEAEKPLVGGIGLDNTKRRLALYYPQKHQLQIEESENSFFVSIIVNMK